MNKEILSYWKKLTPGDILYHLGDISFSPRLFEESIDSLPDGVSLHIIWGNHDIVKKSIVYEYKNKIVWTGRLKEIKVDSQHIVLCHYPLRTWNRSGRGSWQLHGHSHGDIPPLFRQLDVGVDNVARITSQYRPISYEEIKSVLVDHPYTKNH